MRRTFVELDDDLLRRLGESSFLAGLIGGGRNVESIFGFRHRRGRGGASTTFGWKRRRRRRRRIHVPLLTDLPQRSTSESSEKMDASRLEKKEKQLISPTKERRERHKRVEMILSSRESIMME